LEKKVLHDGVTRCCGVDGIKWWCCSVVMFGWMEWWWCG